MAIPSRAERIVRRATTQDDNAIEHVRVAAWQVAYRQLLPPGYFDGWDYDGIIEARRGNTSPHVSRWVAIEPSGELSGFVIVGPSRDEDLDDLVLTGEIYSLYVAPAYWGTGTGQDLMATALATLAPYDRVTLWVLRDNPRARAFYSRSGFEPDGTEQDAHLPRRLVLPEVRYRREP